MDEQGEEEIEELSESQIAKFKELKEQFLAAEAGEDELDEEEGEVE